MLFFQCCTPVNEVCMPDKLCCTPENVLCTPDKVEFAVLFYDLFVQLSAT